MEEFHMIPTRLAATCSVFGLLGDNMKIGFPGRRLHGFCVRCSHLELAIIFTSLCVWQSFIRRRCCLRSMFADSSGR